MSMMFRWQQTPKVRYTERVKHSVNSLNQADAKLDTAYLYIVITVNQDLKSAIVAAANTDFVETLDEYGCRRL